MWEFGIGESMFEEKSMLLGALVLLFIATETHVAGK